MKYAIYGLVMVLATCLLMSCNTSQDDMAMTLTVDINPSIKLILNYDGFVIDYKKMNEDAESLDLTDLVGMEAVNAVELIVIKARAAGFILDDVLEEDFVLITTVPLKAHSKDVDNLGQVLKKEIQKSDTLQSVNVAMIKATKVELKEAEDKKIPLGLYVVNGAVSIDGVTLSVKDYFSQAKHKEDFLKEGEIIEKNDQKRLEQMLRYLDQIESKGYNVESYRERLNSVDLDFKAMVQDLKIMLKEERNNKGKPDNPSNNKSKSKGQ